MTSLLWYRLSGETVIEGHSHFTLLSSGWDPKRLYCAILSGWLLILLCLRQITLLIMYSWLTKCSIHLSVSLSYLNQSLSPFSAVKLHFFFFVELVRNCCNFSLFPHCWDKLVANWFHQLGLIVASPFRLANLPEAIWLAYCSGLSPPSLGLLRFPTASLIAISWYNLCVAGLPISMPTSDYCLSMWCSIMYMSLCFVVYTNTAANWCFFFTNF